MEPKVKRTKTAEQAASSLMQLCARAERSSGDALRLMRNWGLSDADAQRVLDKLISNRFIDDERYAGAFVRDKSRIAGWGAYKIASALYRKGVSRDVVSKALQQLDSQTSTKQLKELLERKQRTIKAKSAAEARAKLVRYGVGRGFAISEVCECVEQMVKDED